MRKYHCLLLLIAGIIVLPNLTWSQPGGKKRGGGGGWDPDSIFNRYSGGRDIVVVSELDPQKQQEFQGMQSKFGLSGDRMTREQFRTGLDAGIAQMRKGGPGGQKGPGPGGPGGADPSERMFDRMDKNKDGQLSFDEMPPDLQRERAEFDKDNNGFIDLNEYKAFIAAKMANRPPRGNNNNQGDDPEDPNAPADSHQPKEETRPNIYRAGNLPKDLPEWFARLDGQGDNDGQVGLYEWRKDGRMTVDQFNSLDLNGDGYITVEEYYRWKTKHPDKKDSAGEALVNGDDGVPPIPGQNNGGMNNRGGPRGPNGEAMPNVRGGGGFGGPPGGGFGGGRGGKGGGGEGFPQKGGGGDRKGGGGDRKGGGRKGG